ncbi:hypothetical protein CENSYa_1481 [Cenarchaeum symbiosum A]|uniref:Chemotaxis methyl-accepting receptor HlyB-like 4HB MCP domain-containing protein n=1 Tax=Cenarchaeum symbiosum (strain A) TaxID=414004 RepID=A0RXN6_CENSY|nr:hypothetical protein CENSYa_1481 [Cenarchaeum symbiosum A]
MASKKGMIITGGILAVITLASFLTWLVPQATNQSFVITDYGAHLDGVENIHSIILLDLDADLQRLYDGGMESDDYILMAEVASSQVNSQVIGLVESGAPEEWQASYIEYMEALRQTNSYIRETMVVAESMKDGGPGEGQDRAEQAKSAIQDLIDASRAARP